MISNAIMLGITLFLAVVLFAGATVHDDGQHFFDMSNSNALRGFWCLIVILVHIPAAYQNRIQDMIGSFAYIGVTFYFMTSAYGLKMQMRKNPSVIKTFWRKRFPKLLVPCFTVNIISAIVTTITGEEVTLLTCLGINRWVMWLLVCYFFFWVSYKFKRGRYSNYVIVILVCLFSIIMYILKKQDNTLLVWCTEIFGFIWGLFLVDIKEELLRLARKKWILKVTVLGCVSCICGLCYLKFKPVEFWGDYLLKIILGLFLLVLLLFVNTKINFGNKINAFLGRISFEVYLTHGLVFGILDNLMPGMKSAVFILMSLLITVILSAVEKYINQAALTCISNFQTRN